MKKLPELTLTPSAIEAFSHETGMKPGYCSKVLGHTTRMFFETYADWIDRDETKVQEQIWAAMN